MEQIPCFSFTRRVFFALLASVVLILPASAVFAADERTGDRTEGENFCGQAAQILIALTDLPDKTISCLWQASGQLLDGAPEVHVLTLFRNVGDQAETLGTFAVSRDGAQWWVYDAKDDTFAMIQQSDIPEKWWSYDAVKPESIKE